MAQLYTVFIQSQNAPAVVAIFSLASCQKNELTNGKVAWEETDEITVTDAASHSAVYKIKEGGIEQTTGNFQFTVRCGLMRINLTKASESVRSIAVTGTPADGSETTYTLTCKPAESIASAKRPAQILL